MKTTAPDCPRCGTRMVLRTASKGPRQGQQFWGCPKFPKCRAIIDERPESEPSTSPTTQAGSSIRTFRNMKDGGESTATTDVPSQPPQRSARGKQWRSILHKIAEASDRAERRRLESSEPDATGRWDPEHREKVLRYVYERDGRRCGLCAGEMKLKGAHLEHIVPKVFAVFDVRKGRAETGTRYKSRLHKLDNLQAAHTYCNKRKGNTPEIREWRHPAMPPLSVAAANGQDFVLPHTRKGRSRPKT